ncbi:MAG: rRNA maturation RNase YbeY [Desulfosalsimonas sp.]|uniref:rRNA maturation RNase YbeY n=1 Tax=Desulfosalsimonas sp. TaxID=3073848 RepID=UPI00397084C7
MAVLITNNQSLYKISTDQIQTTARELLNALDKAEAELSLVITDDEQIAEINHQYLNRSGPTNVIAFPMGDPEFPEVQPELLGDVIISLQTAEKEAVEAQYTMTERFTELLIHGILHLLGYDHETNDADARQMAEKSRALTEHLKKNNLPENPGQMIAPA